MLNYNNIRNRDTKVAIIIYLSFLYSIQIAKKLLGVDKIYYTILLPMFISNNVQNIFVSF